MQPCIYERFIGLLSLSTNQLFKKMLIAKNGRKKLSIIGVILWVNELAVYFYSTDARGKNPRDNLGKRRLAATIRPD